jgi:hypothetical protein
MAKSPMAKWRMLDLIKVDSVKKKSGMGLHKPAMVHRTFAPLASNPF